MKPKTSLSCNAPFFHKGKIGANHISVTKVCDCGEVEVQPMHDVVTTLNASDVSLAGEWRSDTEIIKGTTIDGVIEFSGGGPNIKRSGRSCECTTSSSNLTRGGDNDVIDFRAVPVNSE